MVSCWSVTPLFHCIILLLNNHNVSLKEWMRWKRNVLVMFCLGYNFLHPCVLGVVLSDSSLLCACCSISAGLVRTMPEPSIQHVDTFHFSISLLLSHIRSLLEDKSFPLNHPLGIMLNNLNHLFQEYVVIICGNKDSKMFSTALPGWVWAILVRWHWGKSFYSPLFRCGWHGWWFRSFRIKVFQIHLSIRWCYCIRNLNLPKEIFS